MQSWRNNSHIKCQTEVNKAKIHGTKLDIERNVFVENDLASLQLTQISLCLFVESDDVISLTCWPSLKSVERDLDWNLSWPFKMANLWNVQPIFVSWILRHLAVLFFGMDIRKLSTQFRSFQTRHFSSQNNCDLALVQTWRTGKRVKRYRVKITKKKNNRKTRSKRDLCDEDNDEAVPMQSFVDFG